MSVMYAGCPGGDIVTGHSENPVAFESGNEDEHCDYMDRALKAAENFNKELGDAPFDTLKI